MIRKPERTKKRSTPVHPQWHLEVMLHEKTIKNAMARKPSSAGSRGPFSVFSGTRLISTRRAALAAEISIIHSLKTLERQKGTDATHGSNEEDQANYEAQAILNYDRDDEVIARPDGALIVNSQNLPRRLRFEYRKICERAASSYIASLTQKKSKKQRCAFGIRSAVVINPSPAARGRTTCSQAATSCLTRVGLFRINGSSRGTQGARFLTVPLMPGWRAG